MSVLADGSFGGRGSGSNTGSLAGPDWTAGVQLTVHSSASTSSR
ncbi:hypothetical protein [Saccharothrix xinjiangensis]|uniref:Uncharacterized protein n=1 Tax=Saccharothrix xinjiangensis TaxID=204798 RepID=A0ABV9YCQ4_9PSEU